MYADYIKTTQRCFSKPSTEMLSIYVFIAAKMVEIKVNEIKSRAQNIKNTQGISRQQTDKTGNLCDHFTTFTKQSQTKD